MIEKRTVAEREAYLQGVDAGVEITLALINSGLTIESVAKILEANKAIREPEEKEEP